MQAWLDNRERLTVPFDIYFGLQRVVFANQSAGLQTSTQTISFGTGNIVLYPFDVYSGNVSVFLDVPSDPDADVELIVNLNSIYGFEFTVPAEVDLTYLGYREFLVTSNRTGLFKIYPVFIIVAFWVLIIIMIYFASFAGLWHAKRVDPPVVGVRHVYVHSSLLSLFTRFCANKNMPSFEIHLLN